jgi:ATP-dependent Clp protease ATP-binding subunit ClpA
MSNNSQKAEEPLVRIGFRAYKLASEYKHDYITLEHLLAATLVEEEVDAILTEMKLNVSSMKADLERFFKSGVVESTGQPPETTLMYERIILCAAGTGKLSAKGRGDGLDVLIHMLKVDPTDYPAVLLLERYGLTEILLKRHLSDRKGARTAEQTTSNSGKISSLADAETILSKYTQNLNKRAAEGRTDPLIGRTREISEAIQIFCRKKKNNPILVGDPGCGKTAVVEGMAKQIVDHQVPKAMQNAVIYSLDIGALLAGTKYRGDFEERMVQVLAALKFIPNSILFIDEIHMIMGAGATSGGAVDAANLLKPALSEGTLRCIGSTTYEEFRKHFEKDRALLRRFGKIAIDEPSVEDAKAILRGLAKTYEQHHKCTYSNEALEAAVDLTSRYVSHGLLPDKAIDIIDMAGARNAANGKEGVLIGLAEIEREVSRVAKIPETNVNQSESDKLAHLDADLHKSVFGQDNAIETLVDAVFIARAGLREENKPQGSYLFTGPSGVGKTEVARALADTLGIPLIKFDMSEYMEKHSVSKLIGSPPGYVGFDDGNAGSGMLTNQVEQNPHCVLLLDEIEKAHGDVFNILLQVMDDGKLTNSNGKAVSFRNVILIMTSNAGVAERTRASIGFASNSRENDDLEAINRLFSPEFRNRLDANVRFTALTKEAIRKVAIKFIDKLREMVSDRGVSIDVTATGYEWLTQNGYDPAMGARPMARLIAEKIKKPLSKMLIIGDLKNGGKLSVKAVKGQLVLTVKHSKDTVLALTQQV